MIETAAPANEAAAVPVFAQPFVPSITATKTDSFPDPDGDNKAEPGQTITYTVTITNNGTDATNVVFNDTIDPRTTLVPGSVSTQPIAANDTYNVLGNVRIQPNAAAGLLANDCDPDNGPSCSSAGLTASGPSSSANGGNVTVNANGSFSYNPPAGFEGADSFTYTVTDPTGKTDTATVNLTVNDVVWFVDNTAAAGGDGRLTNPYNNLAAVSNGADLDEPGDVIFVYEGAGAYAGGIVLEDGQRLVGQGTSLDAALASFGITVPAHSDARPAATSAPTLANAGGNVITLADGNTVLALNASASAAASAGISGSGVGGTTVIAGVGVSASGSANGVSLSNLAGPLTMTNSTVATNSSGTAVLISGGATALNFNNTDVSQTGGRVIDIQSRTGGAVTFDAASSVTGTNGTTDAVSLLSNIGATVTFNGPVQLNTNASGARGLVADSGAVNLTNGGNAVSATGGAAVDIENLTANVSFATTFSTNSNGRGIRVDTVSGTASFGNATINNSSNTGVLLTDNSASLTFTDLDIAPAANVRALHAVNNTGTLSSSSGTVITSGAPAVEIAGASAASRSPLNVQLTSVSASGDANGIVLTNTNGPGASVGFVVNGDGIDTTQGGNASGGTITGTTGASPAGIGVFLSNADEVTLRRMSVSGNTNYGVRVLNSAGFNLEYSTFGTADIDAVSFESTGTGNTTGAVQNNLITAAKNNTLSGVTAFGSQMTLNVKSNAISNNHPAINAAGGGVRFTSSGALNLDFDGNTLRDANGIALFVNATGNAAPGTSEGDVQGYIRNNTIGVAGVPNSGSRAASGIEVDSSGGGDLDALVISNNQVFQYNNHGIFLNLGDRQGKPVTAQITVDGNTVNTPGNLLTNFNGYHLNAGLTSAPAPGDNFTVCLDTKNNNFTGGGTGAAAPNNNDVRFRQRILTTVQLPGYTGANNDNTAVINYLRTAPTGIKNNSFGTGNAANTVATGGGGYVNSPGGAPCAQPPGGFVTMTLPTDDAAREQLAATDKTNAQATSTRDSGFSSNSVFANVLRKDRSGFASTKEAMPLGLLMNEDKKAIAAPVAAMAGETVNIPVGTLRAGDSVTITFQVTIENPWTGPLPQVSNQGAVTADGGVNVLTDDPTEAGAANPTVTPLLLPPDISINDATVAEPATGSTNMLFTVSLSSPFSQTVTVNFQTANGGANPATAGTDYTTTSGTVTFAAGETVQTVSVPVLADGQAAEGDETFLVNLSSPTNGVIDDGQATGTITDESVASQLIISEMRARGPNGANDDFVELLNTTDAPITVAASDSSSGWSIVKRGADCNDTPVVVGVIPNGTVIPARGNFLLTGSAYGLNAYATGDASLTADIETNANIGLFTTAEITNISSVNRLDAIGFGTNTTNNCDLLREGNTFPSLIAFSIDHAVVRKVEKGLTQDTTDNAADFIFVDTNGTSAGGGQNLGAPGPENLSSPTGPIPCSNPTGTPLYGRDLIDPGVSVASAPNVARDNTSDPINDSTFGTIDFRRTFTNNTGASVSRLRFRIIDLSTFPAPSGEADLRARTSSAIVVSTTAGNKTVQGTTLEQPPAQPNGGGINSSLGAGAITLATPLANGASVNLRFLFGIQQTGDYNIAIVLESTPGSGKDFWKLTGHTENGGHTDGGCNRAPIADAGADQNPECSANQASVTLDGSGSTDPDGDTPLTYEWFEGATSLGTGQTLNVTLSYGSHTITLKVTDPSGDFSEDTVTINVVDTTDPIVNDPPDVTVFTGPGASSCGATVSDAQLGTATATDGCEGTLPVNRTGVPGGNFFPVGTTQVTYTATDSAGNIGMAVQNVTVIDNTAPVVTPPANITTNADPNSCSATVNPGMATATDNCAVNTIVGTRSDNQPLNAPYPVGTTTITWTATDVNGNQGTAQQTVTVLDSQPPTVSSSVAVTTMGPPFNHALINVGLSATASDNCFGLGPLQVFVYSDEDDGSGPHSPDATNIGIGTLKLRRERDGGSNGRVYLVVVKATDGSGNTAASCSTVTVPASNSAGDHASVNAQAAAASSFCSANNGAAPSGYFPVGP